MRLIIWVGSTEHRTVQANNHIRRDNNKAPQPVSQQETHTLTKTNDLGAIMRESFRQPTQCVAGSAKAKRAFHKRQQVTHSRDAGEVLTMHEKIA